MEEIPFEYVLFRKLKLAVPPLDLTCSGLEPHSREILTTGKSHRKKLDGLFPKYDDDDDDVYI
jgi:hypothetical protein